MALKTMKEFGDETAMSGFRAEFRHIHGVVHPNIPEVFDFGTLPPPGQQLYFTCEFVDGQPLDRLSETWSAPQLHVILVSLCRALAFLHSRSLLHRDIKPQNILGQLDASGGLGLLKLVDFGLAARSGQSDDTVGTIDYMAPEIIAGQPATVASDIYAAGMLLYRLATGRLPFEHEDSLAATRQRCAMEAPPPLRVRPDLPVGLSDVISALIRLKPEERPTSARRVIAFLNEREGTEFPYETPETRAAYIRSATSVSNRAARTELNRLHGELRTGACPPAVIVRGEHGLGRHRLLRDFVSDLRVEGISARVLAGAGDNAAADPHARVLIVLDAAAFPAAELATTIHDAKAAGAWCILGAAQLDPDVSAALAASVTLELRPLDLSGVHRFLDATFPESSFAPIFAEQLFGATLGFAVAIQDTLDRLVAGEHLRIGISGWELLPGQWDVPPHPVVVEHIQRTLQTLPQSARDIVHALACSGTALPRALLGQLVNDDPATGEHVDSALYTLLDLNWISETDEGCTLHFPAVATCLDKTLDADALRSLHRDLHRVWSAPEFRGHPRRRRELLFHDFSAGCWETPAAEAAQTLREVLDDGDLRWVRRLLESCLVNDPTPGIRAVMIHALVTVEYIEGNIREASDLLGRLLEAGEVAATEETLEPLSRYAMLEEKLGHTEHAEAILERCLAILPPGNDSRAGLVYGTLAWIAFKRGEADKARRLAEDGLVRIPPGAADPGHALLLNTVATSAFYRGDVDAAVLFWNRCLEVYQAIHDRKGIANMYNNLGVLAAQSGDRLRARALWQQCAAIAHEINDVHRLAGIYNNLGIDALETGQLSEAEEYYLKALALFRRMRNPREQVQTLSNLGELAYFRADFSRAQAYLQEASTLAATLDDRESEVEPLVYMGKLLLSLDQLEQAETVLTEARSAAQHVEVKKGEGQAWEGLAMLYARRGRHDDAQAALVRARERLSEEMDPLALLHLHLTECAVAAERQDADGVHTALTQARKVADIKWDPFTAARTLVYGLLFAAEELDARERPRVLRQLSVYPDFLWRFHWASARRLAAEGALRKALDEYGRGVAVLKAIATRLPETSRTPYLNSPPIRQFKSEALGVRNRLKET